MMYSLYIVADSASGAIGMTREHDTEKSTVGF